MTEPLHAHAFINGLSSDYSSSIQNLQFISFNDLYCRLCFLAYSISSIYSYSAHKCVLNEFFKNSKLLSAFLEIPWNLISLTKNLILPNLTRSPTLILQPSLNALIIVYV